ncbi:hypothetical protein ASF77_14420 [Massilia sp. Leaf139]|nr:hypothetical protein ASF77_14420 [Massilia sp. Leaf139]
MAVPSFQQARQHLHRQRENNGRGLVAGQRGQGLQVAQLHRALLARQHLGRLHQLFRGLQLSFGVDDLGAPFAFGFGLAGDRAHHRFVEVDVLDLDIGDLDAPSVGLGVEHLLDVDIQALALGQHVVELVFAEHRAQRRLRQLAGRLHEVRHLDDGALGVDDAEVQHGIHLHRHVVARNHILLRHVEHHRAQVDPHHLLQYWDQDDQARPLHRPEVPSWNTTPRSYSRSTRTDIASSTSAATISSDKPKLRLNSIALS